MAHSSTYHPGVSMLRPDQMALPPLSVKAEPIDAGPSTIAQPAAKRVRKSSPSRTKKRPAAVDQYGARVLDIPTQPTDDEDEAEYIPPLASSHFTSLDGAFSIGSPVDSELESVSSKPASRKRKATTSARGQAAKAKGSNAVPLLPRPERPHELRMIGEKPPIWCETRQELCESLPYFKSYQGGHYTNDGRLWGYLLDGFPAPLDAQSADLKVIISHGGGGSKEDDAPEAELAPVKASKSKQMSLASSQSRNHFRIRALENNCKRRTPVALIAGTNFEGAPWLKHLGVRYAVLGHYLITHVWAAPEFVRGKQLHRFYVRFEWVESQGQPWWFDLKQTLPRSLAEQRVVAQDAAIQSQIPISPSLHQDAISACLQRLDAYEPQQTPAQPIQTFKCSRCHLSSPVAFTIGPVCLRETCALFGQSTEPLIYDAAFLQPGTVPTFDINVDHQLRPWSIDQACARVETYDRFSMLGTHCDECGRLNVREEWSARACRSDGCGHTRRAIQHRTMTVGELAVPMRVPADFLPSVHAQTQVISSGAHVSVYTLFEPDTTTGAVAGRVVHVQFDQVPAQRQVADEIFRSLQNDAVFARGEMRSHRLPGRLLTQHFSLNAGAPYHYSAKSPSVSFVQAPPAVRDSLSYIKDVVREVLKTISPTATEPEFNEILSIGYMAGQSMSFHDECVWWFDPNVDARSGEHNVGPIVSSLSLGSDATMDFRLKENKALKASRKAAGIKQPRPSGPLGRVSLRVVLKHSDVLIMVGEGVQKYYEHAVAGSGLRFAATARHIYTDRSRPQPAVSTPSEQPVATAPSPPRSRTSGSMPPVSRVVMLPPLAPTQLASLPSMAEPRSISQPHERHNYRGPLPPIAGAYAAEPSPVQLAHSPMMLPPPLPSPRELPGPLYVKHELPDFPSTTPSWAQVPTTAVMREAQVSLPSPKWTSPSVPSFFATGPHSPNFRRELGFGTPVYTQNCPNL